MQTIQAVFIGYVFVGAFFDQHLANFYISVKRCVMYSGEVFIVGLQVHPLLNNIAISILLAPLNLLLSNLKQSPKNHWLIFDGCLMNQGYAGVIFNLPDFNVVWQLCKYAFHFFNLFLLFDKSFS